MRPAFSSNRQAVAFAVLVLIVLALPLGLTKNLLPPVEEVYSSVPWSIGSFPYLHDQIFEEKDDIDIAFMGSSVMWWGIDTPQVQQELEAKLGRKAVVRSLCWNWQGFDTFYKVMGDLLDHRKVHFIVFYDVFSGAPPTAHSQAARWFRWNDDPDFLSGLSPRAKASFYSSSILSSPRSILGRFRENLPAIPSESVSWRPNSPLVKNPANRLGSLALRLRVDQPFEEFSPNTKIDPEQVLVFSDPTHDCFNFGRQDIYPLQSNFIEKISELARKHGVKLVSLNLPRKRDMRSKQINESLFWPDVFHADITVLGIPPSKLFYGLPDEDVNKLYWDFQHFNENGQKFFTGWITLRLIQIYEYNAQTNR